MSLGATVPEASEEAKAAEWAPFTPSRVDARLCYARTWNGGRGGQCQQGPTLGSDLCQKHLKQDTESFLAYGRVDGHIPAAKLLEFKRAARRQAWGGSANASANGKMTPQEASSSAKMAAGGLEVPRGGGKQHRASAAAGKAAVSGPQDSARSLLPRATSSHSLGPGRPPPSGGWLSAEGLALDRAPGPRARAWGCEELWAASGPSSLPPAAEGSPPAPASASASLSTEREPGAAAGATEKGCWGSRAALACRRATAPAETEWTLSEDALRLLRQGVEGWVSQLLGNLQALSAHRASLDAFPTTCRRSYDFHFQAALLDENRAEEPVSTAAEALCAHDNRDLASRELAAETWQETLTMRQRFFRIGTTDLRTWLRHTSPAVTAPQGHPRLPDAARKCFLQAAEVEAVGM